MVTISTMKWSVAVTSILLAVCSHAAEHPNTYNDAPPYKNHRISENNDTQKPLIKYPVYPVQVYANLSNVKNIFTAAKPTEKPRTTDVTLDAVRLFITPESGKWKQTQSAPASTTPSTGTSVYGKASSPAVYLVTAMNAAQTLAAAQEKKAPVYSPPSTPTGGYYRDASELRNPATADESSKRKSYANGTKIRRVSKTQNRAQSGLLYATTTAPSSMINNNNNNNNNNNMWNATTYGMIAKVQSSSSSGKNGSKPFANVLVPKQMLNGGDPLQNEYLQENSFRPIAAPTFSHKQHQQQQSSIDTNSIENRRVSNAVSAANGGRTHVTTVGGSQQHKAKNNGFAMSIPYKVDEHIPIDEKSSSGSTFDRDYGVNSKRDRSDVHATYVLPDAAAAADKIKNMKYDPLARHEIPQQHRKTSDSEVKYGFTVPESVRQPPYKTVGKPVSEQFREFYPATETPKKDLYTPYNSEGKFDTRPSSSSSSFEVAAGPPSFEFGGKPFKEQGPPASWLATAKPETESGDTEYVLDDHAKNVFKSLLRDMLKSKQPADVKSKPFDADEAIDSYFKINRPNEDLSSTGYSIETDMSCNLRSTKHITDGQCVSTRPVVEAVCADRCLVYSMTPPLSPQRQRSSPLANQQVEALHCVDGDSKFVRVQLKCRDGNTVNNIIRVVINCRCKLHQIQPQMRSNTAWSPPAAQMLDTNQEILNMAASASFERQQRPQLRL